MGFTAAHAAVAGPLQGVLEAGLGVALVLGFLSRPAALVAFGLLTGLWVSEWGLELDMGAADSDGRSGGADSWTVG